MIITSISDLCCHLYWVVVRQVRAHKSTRQAIFIDTQRIHVPPIQIKVNMHVLEFQEATTLKDIVYVNLSLHYEI